MPNDVTVRVVFNDFPKRAAQIEAKADAIVTKTAMDLEGQMKVREAVRTGFLRASTQAVRVARRHWRVVVGADYGAFVNYGTRHQAPQPFVEPAIAVVRPVFLAAMRKVAS